MPVLRELKRDSASGCSQDTKAAQAKAPEAALARFPTTLGTPPLYGAVAVGIRPPVPVSLTILTCLSHPRPGACDSLVSESAL